MNDAEKIGAAGAMTAVATPVVCVDAHGIAERMDHVAVESPLQIRVRAGQDERALSITMRTPGHDDELALGFLFGEGWLRDRDDVAAVEQPEPDVVVVHLAGGRAMPEADRSFAMTSACGVCGKTSIDDLCATPAAPLPAGEPKVTAEVFHRLPVALRQAQATFATTGGLHAAGLFDGLGNLLITREDVGRHNAVDKLVGARFCAGTMARTDAILLVSGRASFELVQKALMARIPILAAVGAPSSAAVDLARTSGMTLLGFVRDGRFNAYSGAERLAHAA